MNIVQQQTQMEAPFAYFSAIGQNLSDLSHQWSPACDLLLSKLRQEAAQALKVGAGLDEFIFSIDRLAREQGMIEVDLQTQKTLAKMNLATAS